MDLGGEHVEWYKILLNGLNGFRATTFNVAFQLLYR